MAGKKKKVTEDFIGKLKRTSRALSDPHKAGGLKLAKEAAKKNLKKKLKKKLKK